jgi:hypothetical protein
MLFVIRVGHLLSIIFVALIILLWTFCPEDATSNRSNNESNRHNHETNQARHISAEQDDRQYKKDGSSTNTTKEWIEAAHQPVEKTMKASIRINLSLDYS